MPHFTTLKVEMSIVSTIVCRLTMAQPQKRRVIPTVTENQVVSPLVCKEVMPYTTLMCRVRHRATVGLDPVNCSKYMLNSS
jgi:hypothetical protein